MAVHALCFVAVTYFGETIFLWGCTMGAAASLSQQLGARSKSAIRVVRDSGTIHRRIPRTG